jgi:hypothetical protein
MFAPRQSGKKIVKLLTMAFGLAVATTSGAFANTIIDWTGANNFDDAQLSFAGFKADKLVDISGFGLYEACCQTGSTNFTFQIDLNSHWTTILQWSSTGDSITHSLASLVPPEISFSEGIVSGVKLTSSPDGTPSSDYNFTNLNYVIVLSSDEIVHNQASFEFADVGPTSTTPLPGSLPLLLSGAGLLGAMRLRHKKRNYRSRQSITEVPPKNWTAVPAKG